MLAELEQLKMAFEIIRTIFLIAYVGYKILDFSNVVVTSPNSISNEFTLRNESQS